MLSSTAEYALRIMIFLTESKDGSVTADTIAEETKVPADYTIKVLQLLGRGDMVRGRRGRRGGFSLHCDPKKTSLLDVVNVIDPLERIAACPLGREAHRGRLCPLHTQLDEVIAVLQEGLEEMTLQSVVDGARGPALCRKRPVRVSVSRRSKAGRRKTGRRRGVR
ncbi:MAG: RrF2 family transcriptional regulator [Planctomycetota bacterium]|jgi:Rrf2 family nitric oxide-sensitive transcriptional repressor